MLNNELNTINNLYYSNTNALNGIISKGTELLKIFKRKSLTKFTQQDIEKYIKYLQTHHNKPATINSKLAYLSKCLKYYHNPLILPYQKIKHKNKNIITQTAYEYIINNLRDAELKQFIQIAYYTGLRASEILKLRIPHIQKLDDVYYLNIYDTKNHKDNLIPVNKQLNETLDNFKEFTKDYKQIYYELKKLNITAHQFRHTFITRCFEQGLDVFTVMRLVNHTSVSSTQPYLHLKNKFLADAVQKT